MTHVCSRMYDVRVTYLKSNLHTPQIRESIRNKVTALLARIGCVICILHSTFLLPCETSSGLSCYGHVGTMPKFYRTYLPKIRMT